MASQGEDGSVRDDGGPAQPSEVVEQQQSPETENDESGGDESESNESDSNDENESGDPFAHMDAQEGTLFLQHLLQALRRQNSTEQAASHDELCAKMRELVREDVANAFASVDRGFFARPHLGAQGNDVDDDDMYSDRPFRRGIVHLSAPSIYGQCVDALDLKPGLSFLNIGSGTGYLSAVIAQIIGPHACHHAIEMKEGLVAHAKEVCTTRGPAIHTMHHRSTPQLSRSPSHALVSFL